jgi:hypothetical protein
MQGLEGACALVVNMRHNDTVCLRCVMCAAADQASAVQRAEVRCSGGVKLPTASTR